MATTIPRSGSQPLTASAVRAIPCPLCSAPTGVRCGLTGCHLTRWLRAFALSLISREQLFEAVGGLVVLTAWQLVEERAA